MIVVRIRPEFDSWREAARGLLKEGRSPSEVQWDDGSGTAALPLEQTIWKPANDAGVPVVKLPRRFVEMARLVAAHRWPDRWSLLYSLALRLARGEPGLLENLLDPEVHAVLAMEKDVRRDIHKMHAFVRFRRIADKDNHYVAWYRPDHDIAALAAPFFVERFSAMQWSIITPDRSLHWNLERLETGVGIPRLSAPREDELDPLWRTYYGAIFNPARVNLKAMRSEMPARFWDGLPEVRSIPGLLQAANARVDTMISRMVPSAAAYLPENRSSISSLAEAASACQGCQLHETANGTVFGEGPADARIVLVGEQPGDQEDLNGRPFIGPAGKVLDEALELAGIPRGGVYLTNTVKHFAYIQRGKSRIHRAPKTIEVTACRPWLAEELRLIRPAVVVCLGATAARALLGSGFRLTSGRGQVIEERGISFVATWHPSAILRAMDDEEAARLRRDLCRDLLLARETEASLREGALYNAAP